MKALRLFFIAPFLVLILGCVSNVNNVTKPWEGQHFSNLVAKWGPPDKILDDGQGGQIFCYEEVKTTLKPGVPAIGILSKFPSVTSPETVTTRKWIMFWVDSDGIIYRLALQE